MTTKPKKSDSPWLPIGERLVLARTKDKNEDQDGRKTASGIIIPDSAKSDIDKGQNQAAVIAIGQEAEEKLMGRIEIGDTVLFSRISIDEVKYEGQKYLIVPLENILGVLKK